MAGIRTHHLQFQMRTRLPLHPRRHGKIFGPLALTAWSSGIVSACHQGDWCYGSWDRIPPGYRVVAFKIIKEDFWATIYEESVFSDKSSSRRSTRRPPLTTSPATSRARGLKRQDPVLKAKLCSGTCEGCPKLARLRKMKKERFSK
jgi:hypothetical protein